MTSASPHPPEDTADSSTAADSPVAPGADQGSAAAEEAVAQAADVARLRSASLDWDVEMALVFDPTWRS